MKRTVLLLVTEEHFIRLMALDVQLPRGIRGISITACWEPGSLLTQLAVKWRLQLVAVGAEKKEEEQKGKQEV